MTIYKICVAGGWLEVGSSVYREWSGRKRISYRKKPHRCRRNALWFWAEDHTNYQAIPNRG